MCVCVGDSLTFFAQPDRGRAAVKSGGGKYKKRTSWRTHTHTNIYLLIEAVAEQIVNLSAGTHSLLLALVGALLPLTFAPRAANAVEL